jgi:hypothetical protein
MKIFYTIPYQFKYYYDYEREPPKRGGHNLGGKKKISQIAKKPSILGMYTLAGTTTKMKSLWWNTGKNTP